MTIGSHDWNPEDFDADEYFGLEDPIRDVERVTKACIYCDADVPIMRVTTVCDTCLAKYKRLRGVTPLGQCIAEQDWGVDK